MAKAPTFGRPRVNDLYSSFSRRRRRFATKPPPGFYDPVLDQQLGAAGRGYKDLRQDTERDQARSTDDWTIARNRTNQQAGFSLADLSRNQAREGQDYGIGSFLLNRRYQQQGDAQRQAGNAAGLLGGGFALQAARKRAENQRIDQGQLDLTHQRYGEDATTSRGRIGVARDQRLGDINLAYQRGNEDRTTDLSRAGREFRNYGVDVGESRYFQARNLGWPGPTGGGKPGGRNRRRGRGGSNFRGMRVRSLL